LDILGIIKSIYDQPEVKVLVALMVANLILGIFASLKCGDFKFTRLADWLWKRVVPLLVGYGVAAFLATTSPDFAYLKPAAYATVTLAMIGYVLSNLKDFGINLPEQIAGKEQVQ
jgi:hypothetical protein